MLHRIAVALLLPIIFDNLSVRRVSKQHLNRLASLGIGSQRNLPRNGVCADERSYGRTSASRPGVLLSAILCLWTVPRRRLRPIRDLALVDLLGSVIYTGDLFVRGRSAPVVNAERSRLGRQIDHGWETQQLAFVLCPPKEPRENTRPGERFRLCRIAGSTIQ